MIASTSPQPEKNPSNCEFMRATQVVARGVVKFRTVPKPKIKSGHALIKPILLSLCGSDVHMLYHSHPDTYPCAIGTSGHEMVGSIVAIEPENVGMAEGDLVLGLAPEHKAMTEYFLAPLEDVLPLPVGIPIEHLLMAQQLGTVIYACKRLPNLIGKDVVVLGQGSAGLYFDYMLKRMGARLVIGVDVIDSRVGKGVSFGATHTVHARHEDLVKRVEEITELRGADLVVEAAGEEESINLAARLVKTGGALLFFGIPRKYSFMFDFFTFFRKYCHTITISGAGNEMGRHSYRMALNMIAQKEIDVTSLITHRFPFERVIDAYELVRTRADGVIKIVVEMSAHPAYRSP